MEPHAAPLSSIAAFLPGDGEERVLRILESITDGFCAFDSEWSFIFLNEAAKRMFAPHLENPAALLGQNHWEAFAATRGTVLEGEYRRAVAEGVRIETEIFYPPWRRWFSVRGFPIQGGGLSVYFRDITAEKQAAERLRESETRFHALADAIPQLAWIAHADGFIHWYNRRWYEYTGTTEEEMKGWGWQSVHDPQTLPAVLERWKASIATGEPFEMVFPLRGADGRFRPFLTRVQPLKDAGGQVVQWFGTNTDVEELRRADQALRESERQLRLIADTAPVLIAHCDREARYKFVNEPYAARFGLRRERVIGQRIADVAGEAAYESIRPQVERALAGEAVEFELAIPYEKLGTHFMRCAYAPERDTQGEVVGLVAAIVDITDRKYAELRLAEQARLLDLSFDAIFVRNAQNRITYWNKGAEDSYGFTREEAMGRLPHELLQTEFPEPVERIYEHLRREGRWVGELRHTRKDGSHLFDSTRWVLDHDAHGQPASILETNTDITDRRCAEALLREGEEKYRGLIHSLPAAVYTCDREGRIQLYNVAAVELWGREPEVGKDLWCGSWRLYHPDGSRLELDSCPMARTLKEGRAVRGVEIIVERPDGSRRHVLPSPDPILNAAGEVTGAVNMLMDITELKQIEMLLREAKETAETANQSKDRFLAVLSHELRTPLMPVLMTVAALEDDTDLRPDVREDMAMIRRNIELETKLIDDLLDLNRITSGKLRLQLETVNLNEAVRQVCGICHPQAVEQGVRLECEFAADAGSVRADPARLQQVLWNLIKNGLKFTPKNGSVHVTTAPPAGGRGIVQVRDSGIGIAPEMLPRIFDAFEQGDPGITRKFGGLGLGLAISKALMELHEGSIRAESVGPGQGATFTLGLPRAQPASGAAAPQGAAEDGGSQLLRLLLVEDHHDTARKLRTLLERSGYAVSIANDVAGALALAGRETFDLVVSDLGLPDGSGYDVMAGLQITQPLPGIAMSGYGMDEDVHRSRAAGFAEHLVKPIDVPQLRAAIRRVMEDRG